MKPVSAPPKLSEADEIAALLGMLQQTGARLEELTGGEVDTVSDGEGRTFVLRRAQEQLLHLEEARQAGILNALPAHIALLDDHGFIISVNDTWRHFAEANGMQLAGHAVGLNYLEVCDRAQGAGAQEARQAAAGIRAVIEGASPRFTLDYPCHSPEEQRWFLLSVAPLAANLRLGVVVTHINITAERVAALKLREAALLLDNIIAHIPSAVQLKSVADGFRIELWNKAAESLYGVPREEAIGRNVHDLWAPAHADLMHASDLELIASGEMQDFPDRLAKTRDRGDIRVHMRKVALRDAAGKTSHVLVVADDITARKRAEHDLQRFRAAMDSSGDGIVLVDRASMRYLDVNQTLCDMVGYTREEVIGMTPMDLFSADGAVLEHDYDAIIADQHAGPSRVDGRYRHRDGRLIPVESRRRALLAEGSWIIVCTARDITERLRAAQELKESERRFSDVLGNVELISMMADRDARITYCNDYLLRLTGWQREEIIGRSWIDYFVPPETSDPHGRFAAVLAEAPGTRHRENVILTRAGERRLIRWNNTLLRSPTGEVTGTASIGEDITEQKQAEVRIRRLNRIYAVLSGINTLIVRVKDRDELFREACRIAVEHGGFRMCWIGAVDRDAMQIVPIASAGEAQGFFELIRGRLSIRDDAPAGHGAPARAARTGQAMVVNDIANDPGIPLKEALVERGIRALASLPLLVGGKAVAVFGLLSAEVGFFDEEEMKLLEELAGDLSFALTNIKKDKKLNRMTRVNAMLGGLNAAIVRIPERQALLAETCRIAVAAGGFQVARVTMLDAAGKARVAASSETQVAPAYLRIVEDYNADPAHARSLLASMLRSGEPAISNDTAGDERIAQRAELTSEGNYALALFPIIVDKRLAGALGLRAREGGMFDEDERALLLELVANLAFALELIEKREKVDYLALYDALTGLANRSLFLERLAQYQRSAVSGGHQLAVFLLDLERFRNINDSLGRAAGDALLRQVSEWLLQNVGHAALLGRVGGDHLAVIMPKVDSARSVARLVGKRVDAFIGHPFRVNDTELRLALKVGIVLFPNDGTEAESLLRNAEAALQKAKERGDRHLFYDQAMNEKAASRLTLENQLRQAIDKEEFVLHYQPKLSLITGKLTGAEALIRWNDPRSGMVPPGRFIPILEETGLIYEVGRWALRQAVKDYLRWRAAGLPAVRLAVNVSPLQLRNRALVAEIGRVIGIDGLAAAGLELEITESLIMEDVRHSIASLQAIREMGVSVAIDDFGTGFSSLSYLAKLPVDALKIDRSFIIDMTEGPDGLALVSTIITLARSLRLKVVAEGVETEEQSRLLHLLSCDEMQGFLFSKPVPAAVFEANFLAAAAVAVPTA